MSLSPQFQRIPRHVAVIMDGNGRWANRRGLPRIEGHKAGVKAVRAVLETANEAGVEYLTLYAFSAENWKRPRDEVDALMSLLEDFLTRESHNLIENETRLIPLGDLSALPGGVRDLLLHVQAETAHFTRRTVGLALNYGSRSEVVHAAKAWHAAVLRGELEADELSWEQFSDFLFTRDFPDPDLIIRTSGTLRLSNFLLLQGAYAELYFSEVCWPDFGSDDFHRALRSYESAERRFGQTAEQLAAETL